MVVMFGGRRWSRGGCCSDTTSSSAEQRCSMLTDCEGGDAGGGTSASARSLPTLCSLLLEEDDSCLFTLKTNLMGCSSAGTSAAFERMITAVCVPLQEAATPTSQLQTSLFCRSQENQRNSRCRRRVSVTFCQSGVTALRQSCWWWKFSWSLLICELWMMWNNQC